MVTTEAFKPYVATWTEQTTSRRLRRCEEVLRVSEGDRRKFTTLEELIRRERADRQEHGAPRVLPPVALDQAVFEQVLERASMSTPP